MVKIKVNVKTKNDSIPSDTTKRKMPIVVDPKLHPHPRYHDTTFIISYFITFLLEILIRRTLHICSINTT